MAANGKLCSRPSTGNYRPMEGRWEKLPEEWRWESYRDVSLLIFRVLVAVCGEEVFLRRCVGSREESMIWDDGKRLGLWIRRIEVFLGRGVGS